ncbi:hypothetical protein [Paenibacillus segetis]|uniref:SWIM-type domain-containing protein n=1 Tax=Paenibacillus segetis TaxID=1325360 RepID=A0ABQ1YTC6_9BACL|nr:hypothetical protein [Paenibacillus segetis]GGH38020.1 hypothetical protein GCM10008013_45840 [Paenibacillus segetis]
MSGKSMTQGNFHMEFLPEAIRIDVSAGNKQPVHSVVFPESVLDQKVVISLVQQLQSHPLKLAALLETQPRAIADLLPLRLPWLVMKAGDESYSGSIVCSCGESHCDHLTEAVAYAESVWVNQPDQRLRMLGLTRESLLNAVLEVWAAAEPLDDAEEELLRHAGGRLDEQGGTQSEGPNIAEWLAEVGEMGRLHLPGPQFHDVEISLTAVKANYEPEPNPVPWKQLLPGVFSAAKGYSLVAAGVMQRAEKIADQIRNKPQA